MKNTKSNKTQAQLVIDFVSANGNSSISDVEKETGILRPNIRRILGQGAKRGIFERVAPGVYVVKNENGTVAYVEAADALESLPKLIKQGWKFDMIFIDPPYFSKSLIGGNRGIVDYDFIFARQFYILMGYVAKLIRTNQSHVYIMLSGARTAQKDMRHYIRAIEQAGFKLFREGSYKKLFKNGSPVTNVRGEEASAERLLLYTLSGEAIHYDELNMDFALERPTGYQTEKPIGLLSQIVKQSTKPEHWILDPCAGSGVTGKASNEAGRNAYLIEKNKTIVENLILHRL